MEALVMIKPDKALQFQNSYGIYCVEKLPQAVLQSFAQTCMNQVES